MTRDQSPEQPTPRRILGFVLLVCLATTGFRWMYVEVLWADRSSLSRLLTMAPDMTMPSLPAFLHEVRARTEPGSRIAIVVPARHWGRGYDYAFFRASYFLTGRTVVPLVDAEDRTRLERLGASDYVASWKMPFRSPEFETVWRGQEGVLLKKR